MGVIFLASLRLPSALLRPAAGHLKPGHLVMTSSDAITFARFRISLHSQIIVNYYVFSSVNVSYFGRAYNPLSIIRVSIISLVQIQYVMSAIYMHSHLCLCLFAMPIIYVLLPFLERDWCGRIAAQDFITCV